MFSEKLERLIVTITMGVVLIGLSLIISQRSRSMSFTSSGGTSHIKKEKHNGR
jgi:hypothetical protein